MNITSNETPTFPSSIALTWGAVSGAVKYQIYRSTSKNGNYSLAATVTGLTYTSTNFTLGKTYYYMVRAVDSEGNVSSFSDVVTISAVKP